MCDKNVQFIKIMIARITKYNAPNLCVVERQRDDVVEEKVGVLQGDLAAPHQHNEVLDGREVWPVLQTEADRQGLRLPRATNDEILK